MTLHLKIVGHLINLKKSGPFGLYINSIFYNVSKCMEYK